jgi:hypothetical protein
MQTCKIILATSLIWFLIDVVVLIYYTDCGVNGCGGNGDSKGPSADPLVHNGDYNAGGGGGGHQANQIDDGDEIFEGSVSF